MQATLELRNLLGSVEGVKCCAVCGKPEAKNTAKVNAACPAHAQAIADDLPSLFRRISKALGGNLMDFVTRDKFNAQLESIRAKLTKAREEHDAYTPPTVESDRKMLVRTLTQTLAMLGVEVKPNPDPESKGEWTPLCLADCVQAELGKLMSIKAECEAIKSGE
jgi:BMFP domain-containing protein YqiC